MGLIDRQAAIDALWKALYEYEDVTEKQFIDSDELDVGDWFQHRIFVQNMSDIDRQTILALPSADVQPVRHGWWKTCEGWDGDEYYECSECGDAFTLIDGTPEDNGYLYCPHCGALMGEVEQDE